MLKHSSTTRMTTWREYDLLNRLRHVESPSTAANTLGLVLGHPCRMASRRRGRAVGEASDEFAGREHRLDLFALGVGEIRIANANFIDPTGLHFE